MVLFFRKWGVRAIASGVLFAILLVSAGFLGAMHPAFDTVSHFRAHLAVCLCLAGLVLIVTRFRRVGFLGLVAGVFGVVTSAAIYPVSAIKNNPIEGKQVYTLFHINLLWNHDNPTQVINEILKRDPELLSLAEASEQWIPFLDALDLRWRYTFSCPEIGPRGGVRIYSKWPMDNADDYCGTYGSFGKTTLQLPSDGKMDIAAVHFRWPWPASGPEQLKSALPAVRTFGPDALVAGDFNATPWSYAVTHFANSGSLSIASGIGPTWLFTELPASFAGIVGFPIDNVAYKGRIRLLSAESLPSVGSDHLPVLVKFQID